MNINFTPDSPYCEYQVCNVDSPRTLGVGHRTLGVVHPRPHNDVKINQHDSTSDRFHERHHGAGRGGRLGEMRHQRNHLSHSQTHMCMRDE